MSSKKLMPEEVVIEAMLARKRKVLDLSQMELTTADRVLKNTKIRHIEQLLLAENNIKLLNPSLGLFTSLVVLNLEGNGLERLPAEIRGCGKTLKRLSLCDNALKALPSTVAELHNLRRLFADNNRIKSLPTGICFLSNLTWLSLDNNKLEALPAQIGRMKNLNWLSVEFNQLTEVGESLSKCGKLRFVSFVGNLKIESLPESLLQLESLNEVRIDHNLRIPKKVLSEDPQRYSVPIPHQTSLANDDDDYDGDEESTNSTNTTLAKDNLNSSDDEPQKGSKTKAKKFFGEEEGFTDEDFSEDSSSFSSFTSSSTSEIIHTKESKKKEEKERRILNRSAGDVKRLKGMGGDGRGVGRATKVVQYLELMQKYHLPFNRKGHWVPDESSMECHWCGVPFSLTLRRHHCRVCGRLYCKKDLPQKLLLPLIDEGVVCKGCCAEIGNVIPSKKSIRLAAHLTADQELRMEYDQMFPGVTGEDLRSIRGDKSGEKGKRTEEEEEERKKKYLELRMDLETQLQKCKRLIQDEMEKSNQEINRSWQLLSEKRRLLTEQLRVLEETYNIGQKKPKEEKEKKMKQPTRSPSSPCLAEYPGSARKSPDPTSQRWARGGSPRRVGNETSPTSAFRDREHSAADFSPSSGLALSLDLHGDNSSSPARSASGTTTERVPTSFRSASPQKNHKVLKNTLSFSFSTKMNPSSSTTSSSPPSPPPSSFSSSSSAFSPRYPSPSRGGGTFLQKKEKKGDVQQTVKMGKRAHSPTSPTYSPTSPSSSPPHSSRSPSPPPSPPPSPRSPPPSPPLSPPSSPAGYYFPSPNLTTSPSPASPSPFTLSASRSQTISHTRKNNSHSHLSSCYSPSPPGHHSPSTPPSSPSFGPKTSPTSRATQGSPTPSMFQFKENRVGLSPSSRPQKNQKKGGWEGGRIGKE